MTYIIFLQVTAALAKDHVNLGEGTGWSQRYYAEKFGKDAVIADPATGVPEGLVRGYLEGVSYDLFFNKISNTAWMMTTLR